MAAVGAITAAICDSSYEAWATGDEDSDSTSLEEVSLQRGDFWTCTQCKSRNSNPRVPFCDRCFQVSIQIHVYYVYIYRGIVWI